MQTTNQQTKPDQAKIAALQQKYKSALLSVDKARAEVVLRDASVMYATPLEIAELCLAPVLEQMGDAWENGQLALSQIYMASRISEELVERILPPPQKMRGETPKIALALLEDHHMLGKRLVQSALRLAGIPVLDWQRVTVEELIAHAIQERPDLILISTLMLRSALRVRNVREGLDRAGLAIVPIYVGGAPFRLDPLLWREVGASATGANSTEAIRLVLDFQERRHAA